MEFLTSDTSLAVFTAVGIVATAISIVRDARAEKARMARMELALEEVQMDLRRAA